MTPKEFLLHALDNVNNGRIIGHGLLYGGEPSKAAGLQHIDFLSLQHYSIIPKTHIVNGFTVPAPMDEQPENGDLFYTPCHCSVEGFSEDFWGNYQVAHLAFLNRQVFATEEAAIANQKAQAFIDPNVII